MAKNRYARFLHISSTVLIRTLLVGIALAAAVTVSQAQQPTPEEMRTTIRELNSEVALLKARVKQLENERDYDEIMSRVTQSEIRADNLEMQLLQLAEKDTELKLRLDQIDEKLQSDYIDNVVSSRGTTSPEVQRESLIRQLKAEKRLVEIQREQVAQTRYTLERSRNSARDEAKRLRGRLSEIRMR
ncbi:MAG: hypothetical protein ABIP75_13655 [Pyrinomonadaceae bacterium]